VDNIIKILVVAPDFPYPPIDGHKVRIYNLFKQFPAGYRFDFISFGEAALLPDSETLKKQLGPCFDGVELIPHHSLEKIESKSGFAKIRNIFFPFEASIGEPYFSPILAEKVQEKVASKQYDLVYLCGLYISLYFDKGSNKVPYIVDICDSMALLAKSYFEKEHGPRRRLKSYLNYVWADRYEKVYCSRLSNIVIISSVDGEKIKKNCPNSRVWVVPNGVDMEYFSRANADSQPNSLLFTGVMDYPPNNEAMLYFIKEIFPIVKKKIPNATLTVAGRNPTIELKSLAEGTQGVRVTGIVDDLRPYFEASTVYISPLLSGTGIKNKVLEAWSMTKAIVATSVSCSGIEIEDNGNILIADSPADFVDKIILLLEDKALRERLSHNGRNIIEESYSWVSRAEMLMNIFNEVLQGGSSNLPDKDSGR